MMTKPTTDAPILELPCARLQPLRSALETVATSMRSACVEKVKAMKDGYHLQGVECAAAFNYDGEWKAHLKAKTTNEIITALESISIQEQKMSRTTMMLIDENGNTRDVAEFSNSWGSAAFVWDVLRKAFLGGDEYLFNDDVIKKVWALWKDPRLLRFEKVVLLSTFDHAIIERDRFADAAEAFASFERRYREPNAVCHMGAISQMLMNNRDSDCVGACFQQTSVAENPWLGEYDAETEDYKPFDMNAGKHFFVFAELQEQEAKQS